MPWRTTVTIHARFLKRLLHSAMPELDKNAGEQMLIYQFLTGVPTAISQQLRATGEAKELTKVVEQACLLMTIDNYSSPHVRYHNRAVTEIKG